MNERIEKVPDITLNSIQPKDIQEDVKRMLDYHRIQQEKQEIEENRQSAELLLQDLQQPQVENARDSTEKWSVMSREEAISLVEKGLANLGEVERKERRRIIDAALVYLGKNGEDVDFMEELYRSSKIRNKKECEKAWCMLLVSRVLADIGKRKGWTYQSPWARSGLGLGTWTDTPAPGDLIIVKRDKGDHIGFYIGQSESKNPVIIGWNQGEKGEVSIKEETRPIRWYRKIL